MDLKTPFPKEILKVSRSMGRLSLNSYGVIMKKSLMLCALIATAAISACGLVACSTPFRKGVQRSLVIWRHWLTAIFPSWSSSHGMRHFLSYSGPGSINDCSRPPGVQINTQRVGALSGAAQSTSNLTLSSRAFMSSLVCKNQFAL